MRTVAGIDSSTQSTTVVFRDLDDGSTVAVASSPHPKTTPPQSEQDPAAWWGALVDAMNKARTAAGPDVVVEALAVSAQAHGLVPLDSDGAVIRPAKLWNDTTSAPEADHLVGLIGKSEWVRRVGSVPPSAFTVSKLAWLRAHEPEHFHRLRTILLPHDWVTRALVGEAVTDASDASGTGYYDPISGTWNTSTLDLIDATVDWGEMLPRLVRFDDIGGTVSSAAAEALGVGAGIPVAAGSADNQAAAVGMGIGDGDVVFSFGTSGVLYARSDRPVVDLSGDFNGNADATGRHLPVLCTLNAAKVTDTFATLLGVSHDEMAALALAAAPRDPNRPVLQAFLDGERVPDRPRARGILAGIGTDTTREQLARAAYEGVILGLVNGLDRLRDLGVNTDGRVIATGGGARSRAYQQLLADLTRRPVEVVRHPETAAAGAAVLAASTVLGTSIDELAKRWAPPSDVVATPRENADPEAVLGRYRTLVSWNALEADSPDLTSN